MLKKISYFISALPFLTIGSIAQAAGLKDTTNIVVNVGNELYGKNQAKPIEVIIGGYIQAALALLGVIFLVLLVYGGYVWFLAKGDDQEVTKAKGIIRTAVIGLIIVLAAYAISYYIFMRLSTATGLEPTS